MSSQPPSVLPEDLLLEVIKNLNLADLKRLALFNKATHEIIYSERNDALIWQPLLEAYFPYAKKEAYQSYRAAFYGQYRRLCIDAIYARNMLRYGSEALKKDRGMLLAAVLLDRRNLEYVPDDFKEDPKFQIADDIGYSRATSLRPS